MKKVSVIMSTYNTKEEYLKQSIESILNQSYKNFEFIIICDGNCDDIKTIKKYKDERIKVIEHNINKGLPYSLNEGIEIAEGEYVARMDADDISVKNRLENQVKFMDNNRDIDICSMFAKCIGDSNAKIVHPFVKNELINKHLLFCNCLIHPLIMIRKSFLLTNNLRYNESFLCSQDFEFWTRCKEKGIIGIIPKRGLYYRTHNQQISSSKKERQVAMYKEILKNSLKQFNEMDEDDATEKIMCLFSLKQNENLNIEELSNFIDKLIKNYKINNDRNLKKVLNFYFFELYRKLPRGKQIKLLKTNKKIRKQFLCLSNFKLFLYKQIYKIL